MIAEESDGEKICLVFGRYLYGVVQGIFGNMNLELKNRARKYIMGNFQYKQGSSSKCPQKMSR